MIDAGRPEGVATDRIGWALVPMPTWQRLVAAGTIAVAPFASAWMSISMIAPAGFHPAAIPNWREAVVAMCMASIVGAASAWWWTRPSRAGEIVVSSDAIWLPRGRAVPRSNRIALDRIYSIHRIHGLLGPLLLIGVSGSFAPYRVASWWLGGRHVLDEFEDVLFGRIRTGPDGAARTASLEQARVAAESARVTLPWTAIALAGLLVAIFLAGKLTSGPHGFAPWGGSLAELVWLGDWHRPFTSVLLHASAPHVAANAGILVLLARSLENLIGRWRWLLVFLCSGAAGALASAFFREGLLVGSSAGVYGTLGVYLALNVRYRPDLPAPYRLAWWVMAWGVASEIAFTALYPSMSRPGHVGGFVTGAFVAWLTLGGVELHRAPQAQGRWLRVAVCLTSAVYGTALVRGVWLFLETDAPVVIR